MKNLILLFAISLYCLSCGNQNLDEKQRETVQNEMKNREVKKVSDVDILNKAKTFGAYLADTSQKTLSKTLISTIQKEGVEAALSYCNVVAYPLMDSLSGIYNAQIKRASFDTRNPRDAPDEFEAQLLEAYQYAVDNDKPLTDDVQFTDNKEYVLYTRPIALNNGVCLNCHGRVGDQIQPNVAKKLAELYPNDKATGHELGDLRGMWSIKIPTESVVKKL